MQLYLHASRSTLVVREFLIALVIYHFIDLYQMYNRSRSLGSTFSVYCSKCTCLHKHVQDCKIIGKYNIFKLAV